MKIHQVVLNALVSSHWLLPFLLVLSGLFLFWLVRSRRSMGASQTSMQESTFKERLSEKNEDLIAKQVHIDQLQLSNTSLKEENAGLKVRLEEEKKHAQEKLDMLDGAQKALQDSFKALSSEALRNNNQSFLDLAKTSLAKFQEQAKGDLEKRHQSIEGLVKPVKESLDKVGSRISDLEKARVDAYAGIRQQLGSMQETQTQLRSETNNLVKALRSPIVRGRWGEIQLKRVVEMAGMLDHCDFLEQESANTETGRLRPDMIVKLPGNKNIVVDAKAPLSAYLESIEAVDEATRLEKLKQHAMQIKKHVQDLSRKSYWDQFQPTPEFVVLFLPGETFFSAALEQDPALIEIGVDQHVILATPTTLIALLRSVAYGWNQERLAENAKAIADLGKELYKRVSDMSGHVSRLGKSLGLAVDSYNKTVGSLETRVLASARKFKELGSSQKNVEIADIPLVDHQPREFQ